MGTSRRAILALALLTSCTSFDSTRCTDGSYCPAGRVCEPELDRCVLPQQLEACARQDEGSFCEFLSSAGECRQGACMPSVCGDDQLTGNEPCDGTATATCLQAGFDRGQTACSESCSLDTSGCASIGWRSLSAAFEDRVVTSLWVADGGEVYAAYVQVLSWSRDDVVTGVIRIAEGESDLYELGNNVIIDLWGRSASEVYAVGNDGFAVRFDGQSWTDFGPDTARDLTSVVGTAGVLAIAAADNTIFADDGSGWTQEHDPVAGTADGLLAVHGGDIYFLDPGPASGLFLRRQPAGSWQALTGPSFTGGVADDATADPALWSAGDELFATYGAQVAIATGEDPIFGEAGAVPGNNGQLVGGWTASSGRVFIANSEGSVFQRDRLWTQLRAPADTLGTPRALDLDGSGESPVLAYLGGVARSSQSHWSVADSSPAGFALWAASRELVVSGGYSLSAVSFAAGPFLQTEPQPAAAVCGAWGRDPTDALVIGRDRSFLYDGSWTEVPGPPGQLPVPCPMWADETSYWVGGEGGAVHAREGATWVDYSLPNAGTVVGLGGADQVIYALVDADGDVTDDDPAELDRVYRYSANSWQEVFSDSGLTDLWVDEQGTVHLVGARCYRAEADDDWRPVILPADVAGRPIRIHGSAPDDVFALTDQSELLHLGDTGWTRVRGVLGGASTLFVTGSEVFVGSLTEVIALTRLAPW